MQASKRCILEGHLVGVILSVGIMVAGVQRPCLSQTTSTSPIPPPRASRVVPVGATAPRTDASVQRTNQGSSQTVASQQCAEPAGLCPPAKPQPSPPAAAPPTNYAPPSTPSYAPPYAPQYAPVYMPQYAPMVPQYAPVSYAPPAAAPPANFFMPNPPAARRRRPARRWFK